MNTQSFDRMIRQSQLDRERRYKPFFPMIESAVRIDPQARRYWRQADTHERATFAASILHDCQPGTHPEDSAILEGALLRVLQLNTKPEVI